MAAIVVAVDFSQHSRKAFDAAVRLAEDLGARLVIVHAFSPVPRAGVRDPIGQAKVEIDAGEWQELCEKWAADARKALDVATVGREGKPADVIAKVVAETKASLVVVGSHGRTGLKRAVLGSVAEAVVRSSKVPVVVVPA
ncbi:MAG: universal stress protein [Candidatus Thermoplasmatota archaeon]